MKLSELSLHQKTTIVAERFLIAVMEKNTPNTADIRYINLENREEVLSVLQKTDGKKILQSFDANYWKVYSEGDQVTNFDPSLFKDLEIAIDVSTRDKTLHLVNFRNANIAAE